MQNRVRVMDLGFVLAVLGAAALFLFEIDLLATQDGLTRRQAVIRMDAVIAFSALVVAGTLFYAWRRAREHARENERRRAAEQEVMRLALQDSLTGLPNRRRFEDALAQALRTVPAAPDAHAVLLLDLNGFKRINDVYGHPAGDQALIHVGARLLRAVREGALAARLGGDEFAVLAPNCGGAEGATTIARRIIDSLAEPVTVNGVAHTLGAAIGVALAPHDGCEAQELLRKADVALYRAKAERRSAMRFFEPQMDARLHERDALERALRAAVEADALSVRFQPRAAIGGGRIAGFEALACWDHPDLGALGPERFLPVAEETGLLARLTRQLLHKACAAGAQWPPDTRLAFDLSSGLLGDAAFGLTILGVLAETGFPPARFELEIDEGALIRDAEAAQALLAPLRRAGISAVADNFGTGYSDLQNLNRLALDRIKIDSSFVSAMNHDRKAAVMVKALIGVAQGLDLAVTADGVRSPEQQRALAEQGCDEAQGALYGAPVGAAEALSLVRPGAAPRPAEAARAAR